MVPGVFILMLSLILHPNTPFRTSVQLSILPTGYFPIIVSPSVNGRGRLIEVDDRWVTRRIIQTRSRTPEGLQVIYRKYFRPIQGFSYEQQQSRFHPSAVGVSMILRHQIFKNRGVIFTKQLY